LTKLTAPRQPKVAAPQLRKLTTPQLPKPSAPRPPKPPGSRRPNRAAPQSAAAGQATVLQALFAETADFDEIVATARAQAAHPLAGIDWRSAFAAAGLAALILVAVVVFMVQLLG
jgi:hypothetical protein